MLKTEVDGSLCPGMGKAQNVAALNCLMEFQHPHCIYI